MLINEKYLNVYKCIFKTNLSKYLGNRIAGEINDNANFQYFIMLTQDFLNTFKN